MLQMGKDHLENDLLNELASKADEVYALRVGRGMTTYSRIHGIVRPNVPPVYKQNRYPFFSCVSRISVGELNPSNKTAMEVIRALDRACTNLR